MIRGAAATSYNPNSNTVDIEDKNGLFDDFQVVDANGAGNDIPEFRQTQGLVTSGPAFTEGNDNMLNSQATGRAKKRRPVSNMRVLQTQADLLLTQSEMQIYDKFKGGNEAITPRGFGIVNG